MVYRPPRAFALFGAQTGAQHGCRRAPHASLVVVMRLGKSKQLPGCMVSRLEAPVVPLNRPDKSAFSAFGGSRRASEL